MSQRQRILTLNQIAPVGLKRLPESHYVSGKEFSDPDAILVRSQDMHAMTIPASVKAIGRAGAGTNNIPVAAMSQRGVPVFNAPGANANAVKELVVAGLLMAARNIVPAIEFVRGLGGDDKTLHEKTEAGKKHFAGVELPGHTLGVVGLGKIGALVADAGIKLGMNVLGFDPEITVDAAWSLPAQVRKAHSLEELLRGSQFVSVHVPLVPATRQLIDARRLDLLPPGAFLLNFARAEVVDDTAVAQALEAKRLRYYICDFPSERLQGCPGVVALPHLGASTREAEDNSAVMVVDQVRDYLEHGNVRNAVNFPDVVMSRESPYRLGIANSNVPNMVGQISTALAGAGLNIHNMLNKSKGDLAYTLVDIDSPPPAAVIEQIQAIGGVLAVRYLPAQAAS
ncbi:D-3-phosphoglycerate dehydrogenase / 2-oxoglutarate reductase [Burkholderiales bacterium]|nr:MAG: phosphoglycerate dehydrogenase [Burkholderiales bacterium]CAG0952195.1 D-3-phosphoglycerate dehydrogenase / 2-oxoglutarate reductase [Burkholderiales bacterium]